MHTTEHPPSPTFRAGTDLPTNVQAISRAVSYVNMHRPRFQVMAQQFRAYGATRLYTHSHELPALTALAQHISHSQSGIDEKRPTDQFVARLF